MSGRESANTRDLVLRYYVRRVALWINSLVSLVPLWSIGKRERTHAREGKTPIDPSMIDLDTETEWIRIPSRLSRCRENRNGNNASCIYQVIAGDAIEYS